MLKNYFKIALRNLLKYKFISFINLFGLAVGFTCCLLILAYILNEVSYDKYNKSAERIYRVTRSFNNEDGVVSLNLSTVAPPFGYYFPTDFPEIEKMTRLLNGGNTSFRYKDKLINEQNVFFADENLFDVFTVDVREGNPRNALKDPFSVMLTEEAAKRYFGNGFCLPDKYFMGRLYPCWNNNGRHSIVYHQLPGYKSGACQPDEELAHGINGKR